MAIIDGNVCTLIGQETITRRLLLENLVLPVLADRFLLLYHESWLFTADLGADQILVSTCTAVKSVRDAYL